MHNLNNLALFLTPKKTTHTLRTFDDALVIGRTLNETNSGVRPLLERLFDFQMVAPASVPLNNGLTKEQNDQAMNAIQKLKVHELSSIISQVNLRRPRAAKSEQQKALMAALFDPQHAQEVWRLAVHLLNGYYDQLPRRAAAQQVRPSPYSVPTRGSTMANHQMAQFSTIPHLMITPQQQLVQAVRRQDNGVLQQRVVMQKMPEIRQSSQPQRAPAQSFDPVPLPFYDVIATVLAPAELPPSSDRNGQKQTKQQQLSFQLNSDQMSKISYRQDGNPILPRYEVQLRFFNTTEINGELKDDFPLNIFARCDDSTVSLPNVIPTNKPNVEPKRPSRPVNITQYISRFQQTNHRLSVEWLADKRSWAVSVIFVHRVDSQILYDRLEKNATKHKSVELTKREIVDKLTGSGEDDIAMDHLKISLLDPLVKTRMKTPARGKDCTHLQCFDLMSYLMMNERKPTWMCPVCSKYCPYDRLIVDDYFREMLTQVDQSTTEVELKQDGTFDVIGRDDEVCLSDDDDDHVELKVTPMNGTSTTSSAATASASATTTTQNGAEANGGKRKRTVPDEDIIVLSDDDDDDDVALNRGIQNSLNDLCRSDRTGAKTATPSAQKTPPPKSKRVTDIEIITLDDTPPRPVVQQPSSASAVVSAPPAFRQTSTSSNGSSTAPPPPVSTAAMTTITDALAQIGHPRPAAAQPQQSTQQQQQQQQQQQHLQTQQAMLQQHQQNAYAAAVAASQQQYGYSMMGSQQQYQLQNGLIGRSNQMAPMQQAPPTNMSQQQNQQQQILSPQYYGQQAMNGNFYYQQYQQYRQN